MDLSALDFGFWDISFSFSLRYLGLFFRHAFIHPIIYLLIHLTDTCCTLTTIDNRQWIRLGGFCPPTLSVCICLFCDYRCMHTQAPTQITWIHTDKPMKLEHTPNDQLSAFGLYRKGLREYELWILEARLWIRHTLGFTMPVSPKPGLRIGEWLRVLSPLQSGFDGRPRKGFA